MRVLQKTQTIYVISSLNKKGNNIMKIIILIIIYFFILYILPFIATDLVFNFTDSTPFLLGLFHVSGIVLCILIERNKDYLLKGIHKK